MSDNVSFDLRGDAGGGLRVDVCGLAVCQAQDSMPGMDMPGMDMPAKTANAIQPTILPAATLVHVARGHEGSGTSVEPGSISVPMWMGRRGEWMLMLHGTAFVSDVQQSEPAGGGQAVLHKLGRWGWRCGTGAVKTGAGSS